MPECPISAAAVETLLAARPELRLDGRRPSASELADRVASFWLPDEVVLYVGLAGSSVASRVAQYYRTPLGARRPHAGGWFLKLLSNLAELHVHHAAGPSPADAESAMLSAFCSSVSVTTRRQLGDPDRPFPFANLEWPAGTRKRHGITGARGESTPRPSAAARDRAARAPASPGPRRDRLPTSGLRTQRMTTADLRAGRVRIPRGATKAALPQVRTILPLDLRGRRLEVSYNPRFDPPPERSGVLSVGRGLLEELVDVDEVLSVRVEADGTVVLT